ncbi:MAG: hypothetical protein NVSMB13_06430 [Mycobacteriales bacterium]
MTGEQGALAAYRSFSPAAPIPTRGSRMLARIAAAKLAVAATAGGLVLTGSVAAAATGSLPAGVQEKAHDAVAKAGLTIPGPNHHAGSHPAVKSSDDHDGSAGEQGKGSTISELATTTGETGVEKGEAISSAASGDKSQAGDHSPPTAGGPGAAHDPGATDGSAGAAHSSGEKPPVDTPSTGVGSAASASNGHSTAGAGNAPTHR